MGGAVLTGNGGKTAVTSASSFARSSTFVLGNFSTLAMGQISYWTLPLMKRSQRARNPDNYLRGPTTPRDRPLGNGKLIENPDSWRKVRKTAAAVYRVDVRIPKRMCRPWERTCTCDTAV